MADAVAPTWRGSRGPTTGRRFLRVVGGLTSINVLIRGLALITGPLAARALGPEGRGELAAIAAPVMILSIVGMLGLGSYAVRQVARGRPPGTILGSVGIPLLLSGAVCMLVALPIASFFADGREVVHTFLLIGILTLPLALIGQLLMAVTNGLQLWKTVAATRLIPPVAGLVGTVALYLTDSLTVTTAATLALVTSLAAAAPALRAVAKRHYRLRVNRQVIREGSKFGVKAWANQLTSNANARLDQLLMARIVPSADLGLYAVAVNAAGVAGLFTTALVVPLSVRVAQGEAMIVARALRMTIVGASLVAIALAALIPTVLPLLFGDDFADATPMALILLAASIPSAGIAILAPSLTAANRPGAGATAQAIGLAVTVPALLVVLPILGGVGAALVSLVAYGVVFCIVFSIAKRHFDFRARDLLVPTGGDLRWLIRILRRPERSPRADADAD